VNGRRNGGVSVEAAAKVLESDPRWKLAEKVARSPALLRATQLREMLLYIVRQTILNPEEPIHEFDLAYQVLGRRPDFNPLDDNIVRVQMAHLRKKLEQYFSSDGSREDTVITVALGTYRPVFSTRSKAAPAPMLPKGGEGVVPDSTTAVADGLEPIEVPNAVRSSEHAESSSHRRIGTWPLIAAVVVILILATSGSTLWIQNRRQQQELDAIHRVLSPWRYQPALSALWAGFLDSGRDTDVVISDDSFLLIEELAKKQTSFYGYLGRSYLNSSDSKSLDPEAQGFDELLASKSLGNTEEFKLAHRILVMDPLDTKIHLYSARQYMPALVKQNNVILIGGRVSNPWSELFEGELNFIENTRFEGLGITTVSNRTPARGEPQTYLSTDAVGYCVVAYLPNPGHDGKMLLLEGTSSEATEAAGDFLLSEDQFASFRNKLHSAQLPYFEVLLKTSQVRGTPLTATVEAYRIYPDLTRRSP